MHAWLYSTFVKMYVRTTVDEATLAMHVGYTMQRGFNLQRRNKIARQAWLKLLACRGETREKTKEGAKTKVKHVDSKTRSI